MGALFSLPCSAAEAQKPVLPHRFGAWRLASSQELSGARLSGVLGDNFAILVESGLIGVQRGTFTRTGGASPASMETTLYRFRDASGVYAAYTFLRTADMSSSDLTEKSAVSRERILVAIGGALLDLSGPGAASLADLKSLVTLIQQQTPRGSYPTLWQYLPGEGLSGLRITICWGQRRSTGFSPWSRATGWGSARARRRSRRATTWATRRSLCCWPFIPLRRLHGSSSRNWRRASACGPQCRVRALQRPPRPARRAVRRSTQNAADSC